MTLTLSSKAPLKPTPKRRSPVKPKPTRSGPLTVYIHYLLDRTGSMLRIKDATIEAFNGFLDSQKSSGDENTMTLTLFDSQSIDTLYSATPVSAIPPLTSATYIPRSSTPLLDAVGRASAAALAHAASYSYDRRIFVIQTDGEENSSIEYTLVQVRDLIARMEADDWQIIFLGAGIDAFANARNMNINTGYTVTYSPTAGSAYAAGQVLTSTVRNYTTSGVTATANLVISPEGKVDDGKGKPPKGKPSKNP